LEPGSSFNVVDSGIEDEEEGLDLVDMENGSEEDFQEVILSQRPMVPSVCVSLIGFDPN
jgi:hypothetical protein